MSSVGALVEELERALAEAPTAVWVERLLAAGVPAGPIHDYVGVFDEPHTHARGMVQTVDHAVEGTIQTLGLPVRLSDAPPTVRRPPPLLGEHTAELLRELANTRDEETARHAERTDTAEDGS